MLLGKALSDISVEINGKKRNKYVAEAALRIDLEIFSEESVCRE